MSEATLFSAQEIIKATGAQLASGVPAVASGVSTDSRTIQPGNLFIALRGPRFDGHFFLAEVFAKGAAGVVVEKWPPHPASPPQGERRAVWKVPDTLKALGDLAQLHRKRFEIPLIAVTGSTGKTTTKAILQHLLSAHREVLATAGTQNNLIGVPTLLLSLTQRHQVAVVEMGSNQWGEIRRLTHVAAPTLGVVTNIGPAHLQTFGDLSGVLREKAGLWEEMNPGAPLILPADDPILWEHGRRLSRKVIWFSATERGGSRQRSLAGGCIRASQVQIHSWGSESLVDDRWKLTLPLPGRHNLMNALASLACARELGEDLGEAVSRLSSVPSMPGRLIQKRVNGCLVLDDTYNANPASLRAALEVLRDFRSPGRKIAVVGDMLELGDQAEGFHREAGRWMRELNVDLLVTVGILSRLLLAGAREIGFPQEAIFSFATPEEAGEFLFPKVRHGDTILVKGSRGMQMERFLKGLVCSTTSSIH